MHLHSNDIAIVRAILKELVPDLEVWIFGSRVHGRTLKPFSDIDLAVISNAPLEMAVLDALKEAFTESDLPYRVDVVDFASASPAFRTIIEQEYEIIQTPNAAAT
jgi:predicted nucleotidyltransferase